LTVCVCVCVRWDVSSQPVRVVYIFEAFWTMCASKASKTCVGLPKIVVDSIRRTKLRS
jgi:hypothetical protein